MSFAINDGDEDAWDMERERMVLQVMCHVGYMHGLHADFLMSTFYYGLFISHFDPLLHISLLSEISLMCILYDFSINGAMEFQ